MGLIDILMGNNTLGNMDIASDMIKDSKFSVISLSKAVTEVQDHYLKSFLESQLLISIYQHHQLSDLAASKDWYKPSLAAYQQVSQDLTMANEAIAQNFNNRG